METARELVSSVDWGQRNLFLAGFVLLFFLVFPVKGTKGLHPIYAIIAASGFMVSGWIGLLTFSAVISYETSLMIKKGRITFFILSTLTLFLGSSFVIVAIDPSAAAERKEGTLGGVWGWVAEGLNTLGAYAPKVLLFLGLVAGAFFGVKFYMKWKESNKYKKLGLNIDPEQMYNGLMNPQLKTVPQHMRDPKRVFSPQMRAEKLKEQKGFCSYAGLKGHPQWEPYREGVQWEGDHIIPWAVGGATNLINLQILCADCNSAKSSKMFNEAERAIQQMWDTKRR